ncbi:MAG: glycosyl transferase family 1 [Methylotenera sp.]|nr:MAG: glycosyl transferase family 1 [Methylotenera sp.]
MKFAFLIFKYFPFGGMQRDMLRTAKELVKRGHSVEIFTISWDGDLPPAEIKVHVLPQKGLFNYQRYQRFIDAAFNQINANNFDYIFGYNRMAGLDAYFAADPCFIDRAYTQRHFLYRFLPRFKWFAACEKVVFSADSATEILAVSLSEKPHFQDWYGTQDARFHYIPPRLAPELFTLPSKQESHRYLRETFAFAQNDVVFILVGSGFQMKGLDRAIQALAALPAHLREHTKLVAVGQDNPKPFELMAKKLGLKDKVFISKGRADYAQLIKGADVYVHPAYRENTGLVILDAMACGAPVLLTASCGYAHHVAQADAGIVHEMPFDQARFNQQFLEMWQTDKKAQWSVNGINHAKKLLAENDGSAEATILINLANEKVSSDQKASLIA